MLLAVKMERTTQKFQIHFGGFSARRMWEVRGNRNHFSKCTQLCKGGWCTCLAEVLLPTMGTSQQPLPPPQVLPRFAFDMSERLLWEYGVNFFGLPVSSMPLSVYHVRAVGCHVGACLYLNTWRRGIWHSCLVPGEQCGEAALLSPVVCTALCRACWELHKAMTSRGKNTVEMEGSIKSKLMMWPWAGPLEPHWSWIYLI